MWELIPELSRNAMTWKHLHSSTTKKNFKVEQSTKKRWQLCFGIVKVSCYVNFSYQKQQPTMINTVKLKKLLKAIERKRPLQLTTGVRLLHDGARLHTQAQIKMYFKNSCGT
jgi:hypothetical protein